MARYLFATVPFTGHVAPGLPIVRELVRRGHEVRWYTTARFEGQVRKAGADWVPFKRAVELDEARLSEQFPERAKLKGIQQLRFDMSRIFTDQLPLQLEDLTEELTARPADVIVGDSACGVCSLVSTRFSLPWAVFGISVLMVSSADTAPFGLGLMPSASGFGRARNKALYGLVNKVLFKEPFAHSDSVIQGLGFEKPKYPMLDFTRGADLYLQGCGPSFEYPRTDLPGNVRFIGSFLPARDPAWTPPDWWRRLDEGRPVIVVTQGTIANDFDELLRPAIRGLAGEEALVVATTGSRPASELGMTLPPNTVAESFVPYAELFPKASVLITNGGYGSIQIALAHGLPVIVFGGSEDKPEIANRVAWSGAGLGFKTKVAKEGQIREAVRRVLADPSFGKRAQELRAELAGLDASKLSGELLTNLAGG
jgi:MGT family glycosyltransferase